MTAGASWAAGPPDDFLSFTSEGGGYVLYHRPSGKTHFVNEPAWILLSQALCEPKSLDALTDDLARLQDVEASDDLRAYIESLLLRFEELGLVERA